MPDNKPKFTHIRVAETGELKNYYDEGNSDAEPITIELNDQTAEYIGLILDDIKPGSLIESIRGTKNAAEVFCVTTGCSYSKFHSYCIESAKIHPEDVPDQVKQLSSQLHIIFRLAGIRLNSMLLATAIYKHYLDRGIDIDILNTVYHLVEMAIELKEDGMIQ